MINGSIINERAQVRRNRAVALFLLAGVLSVVAAITLGIEARQARPDLAQGPVVPGLAETIRNARHISVTSQELSYQIDKNDRGEWVMGGDRGNYPVRADRVEVFEHGLAALQYVRRMTDDPARQERLGVGDPHHGGQGVLVQIEDGRGAYLVNLVLGVQPNGGLFVRRPDQNQVWAARGALPPLRDVSSWADLKPLTFDPQSLARVEVTPASGGAYVLARATADAPDFEIVSPGHPQPGSPSGVTATGEALVRVGPNDVAPAPVVQGPARAHVHAVTFSGVAIDADLIDRGGKTWLKLVARSTANPSTPAQDQAAQDRAVLAINNRAAGWAYALAPQDVLTVAPPLSELLPHATTTSPSDFANRMGPQQ